MMENMSLTTTATIASFGGKLLKIKHEASSTGCEMALNLYLPPDANTTNKAPLLIFLSGLTCTGDNCAEKGFLQCAASEKGIAVLYPDTSPRGLHLKGEDDAYDFGTGASFYVDATVPPWSNNYKMESYITTELPKLLFAVFSELDPSRISITGHSMGGHGALTIFLRNPGMYKSVSALAPICNPINCSWGEKAFTGYLGLDRESWKEHDATELVRRWVGPFNCLIDIGTNDSFYKQKLLLPESFSEAARKSGNDKGLVLRYQEGYDHSYYFVASFAKDHVYHAAKFLFA
ncbi:unnamed protein product [Blumeria hordei]|uniref:S-formylglutathione hydrolase n=1 Tax=Blumeria hordei TaxID=2867405 RepID=A0A383UVY7_BLUHO|nr:unnamed protein product [Blumeria hordei]